MKLFLPLVIFQLTLGNVHADDVNPDCTDVAKQFEQLVDKIYKPNIGLINDSEKGTTWMYYDRLEKAFHAVKKDDLDALFIGPNRLTYEKVEQLFFDIKSGTLKIDPPTEKFIDDLYVFLQDHRQLLDGKPDQSYRILKALQEADRKAGHSAARTDAAITTDAGMKTAETTLLDQAIAESKGIKNPSSKWYDGFINFFSPHNKRMANLLNNNNQLRKKMQSSYASVEPVDDVLSKYASMLSPDEAIKLKGIIASSGDELAEVKQAIDEIYGRQLTQTNPVKPGDFRLRLLSKTIKDAEAPSNRDIARVAEKRLDELDKVIKEARTRKGVGERPMSEYHPAHLEIRNTQYARETGELAGSYSSKLAKTAPNSNYNVDASWDITYNHSKQVTKQRQASRQVVTGQDEAGNDITSTEYYTEDYIDTEYWSTYGSDSGTFTLDASYSELINNKVMPDPGRISPPSPTYIDSSIDSATTSNVQITNFDANKILKESKKASDVEKPLIATINQNIGKVEDIRSTYQTLRKTEKGRKDAIQTLSDIKAEMIKKIDSSLGAYSKLTDAEIKALWPSEIPTNFRARNQEQLQRFYHLANRIDHFSQQIERNVDNLELTFILPDYSAKMKVLDDIAAKNLKTQVIAGTTTVVAVTTTGGGYYYLTQTEIGQQQLAKIKGKEPAPSYNAPLIDSSSATQSAETLKSVKEIVRPYSDLPPEAFEAPPAPKPKSVPKPVPKPAEPPASAPTKKKPIAQKKKKVAQPVEVQGE
ncbi:MAG: hypothetical protein K2Q18_16755 [Bdellovibrionales bacterium]|nr:hypothetical protein [Bdellovibrionales bacterium]